MIFAAKPLRRATTLLMRKIRSSRAYIAICHPWLYARIAYRIFDEFEPEWYLQHCPEARRSWRPPIVHFLRKGWEKGFDPSPDFSVTAYLEKNTDVARAKVNPFVHYIAHGRREGRAAISDARMAEIIYAAAETAPRQAPPPANTIWLSIVVPTYNTKPRYLADLVASFHRQNLAGVELILSDDGSDAPGTLTALGQYRLEAGIKTLLTDENCGIAAATNAGLAAAEGEWVAFLDHDDLLAPEALRVLWDAVRANPMLQFLYTDELIVREDLQKDGLFLKPAYDPVLLSGLNYINHLSVYRRARVLDLGGLTLGVDGSQDYDLCLRYLRDLNDTEIAHIPYPAYWWRRSSDAFSAKHFDKAMAIARGILQRRYGTDQHPARVETTASGMVHRVTVRPPSPDWPKVSVVIPNRESLPLIKTVLKGLYEQTDYESLEVLVVDNGSTNPSVLKLYEDYETRHDGFRAIKFKEDFNFSRSVNIGMQAAGSDLFLLLNNDIEVGSPDWLKEMVSCLSYDNVGIVGAKLLYPNRRLQHAGVIAGFGDLAGHWYLDCDENTGGNMNRLQARNLMTCVTGAAMLITRECLQAAGPWDEENFPVAYNDVDFCLRAHQACYNTIWTPYSTLIHHESATRESEQSGKRKAQFDREKQALQRLHGTAGMIDPSSHPAYSRRHSIPHPSGHAYRTSPRHRFSQST